MDGKDPSNLRGDPITQERYFSREFMQREWDRLWTRIWHIAGRARQLREPGDYIVHNFMHESVIIVMQADNSLKGFYNACGHRAQRLVWSDGAQDCFHCPYHGWRWGLDGVLKDCPDRDDFIQGDPVGKLKLTEVRVATWAGLVWYTMDDEAPELPDYLAPLPDIYRNFQFEKTVRARWVRVALDCNWKFWSDNFNESYHTRTAHPQVPPIIDQDHFTSRYEMFPMGHARIVQMGRPSLRDVPAGEKNEWWDNELRRWDLDPDSYPDYESKALGGWRDLKAAKRRLWEGKGLSALRIPDRRGTHREPVPDGLSEYRLRRILGQLRPVPLGAPCHRPGEVLFRSLVPWPTPFRAGRTTCTAPPPAR